MKKEYTVGTTLGHKTGGGSAAQAPTLDSKNPDSKFVDERRTLLKIVNNMKMERKKYIHRRGGRKMTQSLKKNVLV